MTTPIEDEARDARRIVAEEYPERIYAYNASIFDRWHGLWRMRRMLDTDVEYMRLDLAEAHHAAELQERGDLKERIRVLGDACSKLQVELWHAGELGSKLQAVVDAYIWDQGADGRASWLRQYALRFYPDSNDARQANALADALEALTREEVTNEAAHT